MDKFVQMIIRRGVSRRRFLAGLAAGSFSALLAACRRATPIPTPTPTRTPRPPTPTGTPTTPPTATASATPTAAVTPTAIPPATHTATATATRPPPPTATPTATPFPPGPPTRLGLFISRNDPRIFDLLRTGNVAIIKTLEYDPNFVTDIKKLSPKTLLIGRIHLPQLDLAGLGDPPGAARAFVEQLLPIATEPRRKAAIDAWEAYNEPVAETPEHMARLAQLEAERTRLLAAEGIRSVIGNFSTGTPPLELWPNFRPALEAALQHRGYLGLHEYSAPTMQFGTPQDPLGWGADPAQEGWLTLRYRKVYRGYLAPNKLVLPLVITETGVDGAVTNRPGPAAQGWMDFRQYWDELGMGKDAAGNYVEQLAWYDRCLQQDDYVLAAAIFAAAASPGFETYEVLDEVFPFLNQYLAVHPARQVIFGCSPILA
jgi:hypothetical protein